MLDQKKPLKVWKVYPEDHACLDRLGTREQTQPDILHTLIAESEWLPKLESAYAKSNALNEEGKKTGKASLLSQAANVALSTLKAYIEHIKERSQKVTNDSKEVNIELVEPIAKKQRELTDLFTHKKISKEEYIERQEKIIEDLEKLTREA